MNKLQSFVEKLADLHLRKQDSAIAILWFHDLERRDAERTAGELNTEISSLGVAGANNIHRLNEQLKSSKSLIRGNRKSSFRLSLKGRIALSAKYSSLIGQAVAPAIHPDVIPDELVSNTRPYFEKIAHQINGNYQFQFYDGCLVLCRRLVESLLIEVFVSLGKQTAIQNGAGQFLMLEGIIGQAKNGQSFRLSRNVGNYLDEVKEKGDLAAHNRTYTASKQDVDDLKLHLRVLITDLLQHIPTRQP